MRLTIKLIKKLLINFPWEELFTLSLMRVGRPFLNANKKVVFVKGKGVEKAEKREQIYAPGGGSVWGSCEDDGYDEDDWTIVHRFPACFVTFKGDRTKHRELSMFVPIHLNPSEEKIKKNLTELGEKIKEMGEIAERLKNLIEERSYMAEEISEILKKTEEQIKSLQKKVVDNILACSRLNS